jgi:hypothetical protein
MKQGDLVRKKEGTNKGNVGIIIPNHSRHGFTVAVITETGIQVWMEEQVEVVNESNYR